MENYSTPKNETVTVSTPENHRNHAPEHLNNVWEQTVAPTSQYVAPPPYDSLYTVSVAPTPKVQQSSWRVCDNMYKTRRAQLVLCIGMISLFIVFVVTIFTVFFTERNKSIERYEDWLNGRS